MSTVQNIGSNTTAVTIGNQVFSWTDANANGRVDQGDVVTRSSATDGSVLSYVVGADEAMMVQPTGAPMTTWDVFFDVRSGVTATEFVPPPPADPMVLDLNGNGVADITGANILGDGRVDGGIAGFDLTPHDRQWSMQSTSFRPGDGSGVPALPPGTTAEIRDADGSVVRRLSASETAALEAGETMGLDLEDGQRVEFRDTDGRLVGELKQSEGSSDWVYFYGNANFNEWTSAWTPTGGGDGLLVWDVDGDGMITSAIELFGETDLNGNKVFANGYEKLAHYFDSNGDGVVSGDETEGLQIWEDRDGDGITDEGELVSLEQHGISRFNTEFDPTDMSSSATGSGAELANVTWTSPATQSAVTAAFDALFQDAADGTIDNAALAQAIDNAVVTGGQVDTIGVVGQDFTLQLGDGQTSIGFDVDAAFAGSLGVNISFVDSNGQARVLTIDESSGDGLTARDATQSTAARAAVGSTIALHEYSGANVRNQSTLWGDNAGTRDTDLILSADGLDRSTGRVSRPVAEAYQAELDGDRGEIYRHAFELEMPAVTQPTSPAPGNAAATAPAAGGTVTTGNGAASSQPAAASTTTLAARVLPVIDLWVDDRREREDEGQPA
jgi:hypothetical protein